MKKLDKVLMLYSNPIDTERIRLDKEHRVIDQVLDDLGLPDQIVNRRHAVTYKDLLTILADSNYSIIQFSGHGTKDGIYLEGNSDEVGDLVTAHQIAALLSKCQPYLKLAVFMSCFSASALPDLIKSAPYLLTVFGAADDKASIEFIKFFYKSYFQNESIERSFFFAQEAARESIHPILSRRGLGEGDDKILFQVFPRGNHYGDSLLVDLSDAEGDIEALDVSRESFLSALSRKIRLHSQIFNYPRDHAYLPIGTFFGVFSWKSASDVIRCHQILKIRPDIDEAACEVWAGLVVDYNDNAIEGYRLPLQPTELIDNKLLAMALRSYTGTYNFISDYKNYPETLNKYVPDQYKMAKSLMKANLDKAKAKLEIDDYQSVVVYLESALSALHDLLDALTDKLTVTMQKHD